MNHQAIKHDFACNQFTSNSPLPFCLLFLIAFQRFFFFDSSYNFNIVGYNDTLAV